MENKTPKICAVICELNPAHAGHKYLFEQTKKISGCDFVVAIISPNFVQRGEPSIFDMQTRASMAIEIGADAVIAMPTQYATASAEIFCRAGVEIAKKIENIKYLAFGIEQTNLENLLKIKKILKNNAKIDNLIQKNCNFGFSYSISKLNAINELCNENGVDAEILKYPNNMLAIEYLMNLDDNITPIAVERIKDISSSDIREMLVNKSELNNIALQNVVPKEILPLYENEVIDYNKYYDFALNSIAITSSREIASYRDINEGMENLFTNKINQSATFEDFLLNIKSKRYSYKRLNRAVLACALKLPPINAQNIIIDNLKLIAIKKEMLPFLNAEFNLIKRANDINFEIDNSIDERATRLYNRFFSKTQNKSFYLEKLLLKE